MFQPSSMLPPEGIEHVLIKWVMLFLMVVAIYPGNRKDGMANKCIAERSIPVDKWK